MSTEGRLHPSGPRVATDVPARLRRVRYCELAHAQPENGTHSGGVRRIPTVLDDHRRNRCHNVGECAKSRQLPIGEEVGEERLTVSRRRKPPGIVRLLECRSVGRPPNRWRTSRVGRAQIAAPISAVHSDRHELCPDSTGRTLISHMLLRNLFLAYKAAESSAPAHLGRRWWPASTRPYLELWRLAGTQVRRLNPGQGAAPSSRARTSSRGGRWPGRPGWDRRPCGPTARR